jgi:hypothetical protein
MWIQWKNVPFPHIRVHPSIHPSIHPSMLHGGQVSKYWVHSEYVLLLAFVYTWSRIMPIGVLDPIPNPCMVWVTDSSMGNNISKRNKFPVEPWRLWSSTSKIPLKKPYYQPNYLLCILFCQQLTHSNLHSTPFKFQPCGVPNRGPYPAWIY